MAAEGQRPGEPILLIDHLTKKFGEVTAVDDVSLTVHPGEFLTFLGPSGCGKTSLLRMIAGFETPTTGDIRIAGQSMRNVPPYRRPVGIVFQNLALFPHLSVGSNVGYGLRARRRPEREITSAVSAALALVELDGLEHRRIDELSGGQRQRVALARALVLKPQLLLLDEPLGALDLKLRRQLQFELKSIQKRVGTTFLFVTHDQEEALTMSDRIAIINRGRIEQLDTPEAIYADPASTFVARFVGDTNLLDGVVHSADSARLDVELTSFGKVVLDRHASLNAGDRLTLSVRPEHVHVTSACNSPGSAGDPTSAQGTVIERSYAGANARIVIDVHGIHLVAWVPSVTSGGIDHRPGSTVSVQIDLKRGTLLKTAQGQSQ